jgi:hypothetical protein
LLNLNKRWCKFVGETIAWNAQEFVKLDNTIYMQVIVMQGLQPCSFPLLDCLPLKWNSYIDILGVVQCNWTILSNQWKWQWKTMGT